MEVVLTQLLVAFKETTLFQVSCILGKMYTLHCLLGMAVFILSISGHFSS